MKHIFSILVTLALLLSCMASFAIPLSAAGTAVTPTETTSYEDPQGLYVIIANQISAGTTTGTVGTTSSGGWSGREGTMDWSVIPLDSFLKYKPSQIITSGTFEIVGKFSYPTTVHSFAVSTVRNSDRFSDVTFSFSKDGSTWVEAVTTGNRSANASADVVLTYLMPEAYAQEEYQYVKLTRASSTAYLAFAGVKFYTETPTTLMLKPTDTLAKTETTACPANATVIPVTGDTTMSSTTHGTVGGNINGTWDGKSTTLSWSGMNLSGFNSGYTSQKIVADGSDTSNIKIVGKFDEPTRVSGFAMKVAAAVRLEDVSVAFSADGTNWTTVAYIVSDSWSGELIARYTMPTEYADELYSYVKIERALPAPQTTTTDTQLGGFECYTDITPQYTGSQSTKVNAETNTNSIRFVATIQDAEYYTDAGFEIAISYTPAGAAEAVTLNATIPVATVYESIVENVDGTENMISAAEYNGKYFMVLTITDLPTNSGAMTFTVTPYAITQAQNTIQGTTVVSTYTNGVHTSTVYA